LGFFPMQFFEKEDQQIKTADGTGIQGEDKEVVLLF
jgi:hypothetical protein